MARRKPTKPPPESRLAEEPAGMRLQRFLAAAGLGSRRTCEDYIREGRVTVDGEPVLNLGSRVDPRRQEVRVDGDPVRVQPKRYFLVNKPPGVVSTHRDPAGRPRVVDLVPQDGARLFTVGRLDANTRGLLLVTNDGELANRLAHPRFGVPRRYRVQVVGRPTPETLAELRRGMRFAEGLFKVERVRQVGKRGQSTFLELELRQGRNREIRRLLARAGHKVIDLERTAFGPLQLGSLKAGQFRPLRTTELKALRALAEQHEPPPSPRERRPGRRRK